MEPAIVVALLWGIFGGTHVLLATRRVRASLVARLGEPGFTAFFSLVAAVAFAALVAYYAAHRFEGVAGPGLAHVPALRLALSAVIVAGLMLVAAGLAVYPTLPTALFSQPLRGARGIERITRHPFFAGSAIFALAHALVATHLVGTVFTAGFAVLALAGARHQDTKLLARRGGGYADYLAATSIMPFAAVLAGRQRLAWRELPLATLAVGLGVALALRAVHDAIFAYGGAWIVLTVVGGGAIATLQAWRRARRLRERAAG